ncbi:hypothetical protein [Isoptericola sp. BMS4]|uniref:hypothetical protein n=1 Tax=Isoptericola sp. BMS4 TaxID=2527875 RepID=UPI00141FEFB6|nr:hypothetical protein [Isoptericola sp. BMS4]
MNAPDDPTLDERLARLAPSVSPDPDRLAAARAALDAATALHPDDAGAGHDRRSSVEGGAHVIDLDPHDDGHVEVVTPLDAASRARDRRRRRVTLAAASVGVLGVVGTALVLSPVGPNLTPATPERACAALMEAGMPGGPATDLTWRTLASESRADAHLALVQGGGLTGLCEGGRLDGHDFTRTTTWPAVPDEAPEPDEVRPSGVSGEIVPDATEPGWYVVWGLSGGDVRDVRLQIERHEYDTDGSLRHTAGTVVEVDRAGDGRWSAALDAGEVLPDAELADDTLPDDVEVTLLWQVDGQEHSLPMDAGWQTDDHPSNVLVQARRTACEPNWRGRDHDLVVEERRGDRGVMLVVDEYSAWFAACVQNARPPYEPFSTVGGDLPRGPLAPDDVRAVAGGGSGPASMLVGRAGDDVSRVEARTADGARVDAIMGDGYWVATHDAASDDPWDDATLTWFLDDGSKGGSERVFE